MGSIVDVILHLGAHRTGTTSLQAWLLQNEDALARVGTAVWGPDRTRSGLFAGLLKRPDLVGPEDEAFARTGAARIRHEIDRLAEQGVERLVISEENTLGSMLYCLDQETIYPDARARFDRLAWAFGPHLTGLALSIRRYDLWWASVLAVGRARGLAQPGPRGLDRLVQHPRGWTEVAVAAQAAFGTRPIRVWSFEAFAGNHPAQVRAMVPGMELPSGLYEPGRIRNASQPCQGAWPDGSEPGEEGRYMPFSPSQRATMLARYHDDIARLRNATPGLNYVENAETSGAHPGAAAEEEGLFHDEQKRGMG